MGPWIIFSLLAASNPTRGASPPLDEGVRPAADASFGLVVSGGVSLGAYQAGFIYLSMLLQRELHPDRRLVLATGTSAGSANALVAVLDACRPSAERPEDALGWKVWTPVGLGELYDEAAVTPVNLLARRGFQPALDALWDAWSGGLDASCDVVLGLTVTRLEPHAVEVRPGFRVPRQEEKIRLRLKGRGPGRFPKLENYVDPRFHLSQMVLNLRMDDHDPAAARHNFEQLTSVIFASTGFPAAFAPQALDYCLLEPAELDERVDPEAAYCPTPTHRDVFIDGGVFENYPLRLADRLVRRGLRVDDRGRPRWRDLTRAVQEGGDPSPPPVYFAYVDPFRPTYPPLRAETSTRGEARSFLELLGTITSSFVGAARGKELYAAIEEDPEVAAHMFLSSTSHPPASEPLNAFLGLMERRFRRFDFVLGMYDALVLLQQNLLPGGQLQLPAARAADDPSWRSFACMLGLYDPAYGDLRASCLDPAVSRDFRVLLQVSLDRLHDHCRRIPPSDLVLRAPHPGCEAASRGDPRPRVPGLEPLDDPEPRRRPGETHFVHATRLLGAYRFHFEDLGLSPSAASRGRLAITRTIKRMGRRMAGAQPDPAQATLLRSGLALLTDGLAHDPPRALGWGMVGTALETGVSGLPFDEGPRWLRLAAAFQYKGWTSLLTDAPAQFVGVLLAGVEVEITPLASGLFVPYLGLRGGGQLGTVDDFGNTACSSASTSDVGRDCSQAIVQAYLAATALGWLRLHLGVDIHPAPPTVQVPALDPLRIVEERRYVGLQAGLGVQLD